ncbi:MAG: phosphodiester glycosidase family protein [Actinomycetota bacterium]
MTCRTLAALLVVALLPAPATARTIRTRHVAPGIKVTTIRRWKPNQRIFVASVKLSKASSVRTALATGELPGFERTSSMARRRKAFVAINGDYARPSGRPVMTFARGGRLLQTELTWGRNFAVSGNEKHAYFGHPRVKTYFERPDAAPLEVARVNAGPTGPYKIGMYTEEGGSIERPPRQSCSARLQADSIPRLGPEGTGVITRYRVKTTRCSYRPLRTSGGIVLATPRRGARADDIRSLRRGDTMTMDWSLGWSGVSETVGGNPTLLEDGRMVVEKSNNPFFLRHPRTGVGITRDERLLLVAVDGRRPRYSVGMRLREFARFFRTQGATWALNLDGGGSTTMIVRGRVINRPSDGPERPVSSALLVVGRRWRVGDRLVPRSGATAAPTAGEVWEEIAADPASTGGLAEALADEGRSLDPELQRAARTFARR